MPQPPLGILRRGSPRRFRGDGTGPLAQRIEQRTQAVVIELLHEREQPADFPRWKTFAREPIEVMAREVGHESAFVFAERHG